MRLPALLGSILGLMLPLLCAAAQPDTIDERYAIALRGEAKYAAGFSHVDYANPAAPKGVPCAWPLSAAMTTLTPTPRTAPRPSAAHGCSIPCSAPPPMSSIAPIR
ncbi:hypothetical protein N4G58_07205 [Edwardsiella piscicida]|nr:hypothetical protein N4G58_07205 [Edwardsiella piscicida]